MNKGGGDLCERGMCWHRFRKKGEAKWGAEWMEWEAAGQRDSGTAGQRDSRPGCCDKVTIDQDGSSLTECRD